MLFQNLWPKEFHFLVEYSGHSWSAKYHHQAHLVANCRAEFALSCRVCHAMCGLLQCAVEVHIDPWRVLISQIFCHGHYIINTKAQQPLWHPCWRAKFDSPFFSGCLWKGRDCSCSKLGCPAWEWTLQGHILSPWLGSLCDWLSSDTQPLP